jgi:hypothetical protein
MILTALKNIIFVNVVMRNIERGHLYFEIINYDF